MFFFVCLCWRDFCGCIVVNVFFVGGLVRVDFGLFVDVLCSCLCMCHVEIYKYLYICT